MLAATSCTPAAIAKFHAAAELTGLNLSGVGQTSEIRAACIRFGRQDVRYALRHGEHMVCQTRAGNLTVRRVTDKTVEVSYIRDVRVSLAPETIVTGTIAEVAPVLAGLYHVRAE